MSPSLAASVSAAVAILLVAGPRGRPLDRLRPRRLASATAGRRRLAVVGGVAVVGVVALGRPMLLILVVAGVAAGLHGLRQRARRRAVAVVCRAHVIEACGVLASDLRAGRMPGDALASAATICPELGPAASAARLGDDVPAALDLAATKPGASGLRALSAGWRVAEQSGAALAAVAERIADALRSEEQVRRQVVAGLAGTRATGRLLAGLPVLGLGLGYAVGAHPLEFLTGTLIGWLCLSVGLVLAGAGMAWIERLADSCEGDLR